MMTLNEMINGYNSVAYTHSYIFGFNFKGNVYMSEAESNELEALLTLDRTSSKRGGAQTLRFKPNTTQKIDLMGKAIKMCSVEDFEQRVSNTKYNRGEVFEAIITEYFGQEWTKDNVPFTEDGDITVNGKAIQIKYEKATFVSETQLKRLVH